MVTLIVVRLLSPEDYGLLSMAMVFVGFLYMVAEFGLGPAVVQKADVSETELRLVSRDGQVTHLLPARLFTHVEIELARRVVEQAFVQQPGGEEYRAALFRKLGPLLAKRDVVEIQGWTLSWTTDPTAVPAFNFAAPDEEILLGRIRVPRDRHNAQATLRSR